MAAYRARVSCLENRLKLETLAERRRTKFEYIVQQMKECKAGEKDEIESRIPNDKHPWTARAQNQLTLGGSHYLSIVELSTAYYGIERERQLKIARQTMQQLYEGPQDVREDAEDAGKSNK